MASDASFASEFGDKWQQSRLRTSAATQQLLHPTAHQTYAVMTWSLVVRRFGCSSLVPNSNTDVAKSVQDTRLQIDARDKPDRVDAQIHDACNGA